jgi:chondroitin AC lyase
MISKHTLYKLLLLIIFFSANGCSYWQPKEYYQDQVGLLRRNTFNYYLSDPIAVSETQAIISSLNEVGFWPRIDYDSKERGVWPPMRHVTNLFALAKAYQYSGSKFYQSKKVLEKFNRAFNFWIDHDFQSHSWWYNQINVPRYFGPIMILMEDVLTDEQKKLGRHILERSKIGMTGQNKVWQSGNVLLKSIFLKDVESIKQASRSIKEVLIVTQGEGIQADGSFHQHGPQLQLGTYGLSFVGEMAKLISLLKNSSFTMNAKETMVLRDYVLNGLQWVIWKDQMDISACGRQLFNNETKRKAARLERYLRAIEKIDRFSASEYRKARAYYNLRGNKHFWRSDFQVQRDLEYYFSVKMSSARVIGAESLNGENKLGYYLGDGATYLYQTGNEYLNIFPFWDWDKIPGTTTHQENGPLRRLKGAAKRIESDFVGGVSDGQNGIAVMDYNRDGLRARKSWFMLDNKIICLGAEITSSENLPVTTSINQSFLRGRVLVKSDPSEIIPSESETLHDPAWILNDNVGYFFPDGGTLKLETKAVDGSWHRVVSRYPDKSIKARLFKLWVEHGMNPTGNTYAYILIPHATRSILRDMELQPHFEIQNESSLQMVVKADQSLAGIVFYTAGEVDLFGGIHVDQPCLLLLKQEKEGFRAFVSDPTQKLESIEITLRNHINTQNPKKAVHIDLPRGAEAGKSVMLFLS